MYYSFKRFQPSFQPIVDSIYYISLPKTSSMRATRQAHLKENVIFCLVSYFMQPIRFDGVFVTALRLFFSYTFFIQMFECGFLHQQSNRSSNVQPYAIVWVLCSCILYCIVYTYMIRMVLLLKRIVWVDATISEIRLTVCDSISFVLIYIWFAWFYYLNKFFGLTIRSVTSVK